MFHKRLHHELRKVFRIVMFPRFDPEKAGGGFLTGAHRRRGLKE
jgi:hypothetical protein